MKDKYDCLSCEDRGEVRVLFYSEGLPEEDDAFCYCDYGKSLERAATAAIKEEDANE